MRSESQVAFLLSSRQVLYLVTSIYFSIQACVWIIRAISNVFPPARSCPGKHERWQGEAHTRRAQRSSSCTSRPHNPKYIHCPPGAGSLRIDAAPTQASTPPIVLLYRRLSVDGGDTGLVRVGWAIGTWCRVCYGIALTLGSLI